MIQKLMMRALTRMPSSLFSVIEKKSNSQLVSRASYSREYLYAERLKKNFRSEMDRIAKNRRLMIISKGMYPYGYFNATFLNDVIGLIFYSLRKGCIPVIAINQENEELNSWDWYFRQPLEVVWPGLDVSGFQRIECDAVTYQTPNFADVYKLDGDKFQLWHFLYEKFVKLNDKVNAYINDELSRMPKAKTLGTLIRGTDYTTLRPKFHPIQPEVEELAAEITTAMQQKGYEFVYVATEEKRLFDILSDKIGSNHVLSNKRKYYDEVYYGAGKTYIGEVKFERENDAFLRGLEYLSSLVILSKCSGFVGGNCGGTLTAVLLTENTGAVNVINKGFY